MKSRGILITIILLIIVMIVGADIYTVKSNENTTAVITKITYEGESIQLQWDGAKGKDTYYVFRKVKGEGSYTEIAEISNNTTFTDNDITLNKWHKYIISYKKGCIYYGSDTRQITPKDLEIPELLSIKKIDEKNVEIQWTSKINSTYEILKKGKEKNFVVVAEITATGEKELYRDTNSSKDSIYTVREVMKPGDIQTVYGKYNEVGLKIK